MMNKETYVTGVGKRMPYKIEDGLFDDIERNVLKRTGCEKKPVRRIGIIATVCAAAASLALFVMLTYHRQPAMPDTLAEVQRAFAGLDDDDRAFLSDVYDEDTFINVNY